MSPEKTVVDAKAMTTLVSDSTVDWLEYRLDINVKLVPGSERPFPIVEIGGFSWYPSREQMVELRDKLSAYLEANPAPVPGPSVENQLIVRPMPEPAALEDLRRRRYDPISITDEVPF